MNRFPPSERAINAPAVVLGLIGAFVIIHLIRTLLPMDADLWVLLAFAFIPARYAYAFASAELPGGYGADVWTFLTHLFLHGGWAHLLVNCFWMLAFGTVVARRLGTYGFLLLTAISGIAGATLHLMVYWGELAPVIGASAGISGQMGAAIRLMFSDPAGLLHSARSNPRHMRVLSLRETFTTRGPLTFILVWLGINLVFGLMSFGADPEGSIAWEAHIGGFFAGLLVFGPIDRIVQRRHYW